MHHFLESFITLTIEEERKFEQNNKNLQKFTNMLFEYETLSMEVYNSNDNAYLGTVKQHNNYNLTLFNNPANEEIRQGFSRVIETVINPFKEMRLWLRHEINEIDGLLETFSAFEQIKAVYRRSISKA